MEDEPGAVPVDGLVVLAVAVVVPRYRNVGRISPVDDRRTAVRTPEDVPVAVRRTVDSDVVLVVSVIVGFDRFVSCDPPSCDQRTIR